MGPGAAASRIDVENILTFEKVATTLPVNASSLLPAPAVRGRFVALA